MLASKSAGVKAQAIFAEAFSMKLVFQIFQRFRMHHRCSFAPAGFVAVTNEWLFAAPALRNEGVFIFDERRFHTPFHRRVQFSEADFDGVERWKLIFESVNDPLHDLL